MRLPQCDGQGLFRAACDWIEAGWCVVICGPDKRPFHKYRHGAPLTPPDVERLLTRCQNGMLAVRLPKSVAVLDCDPRDRPMDTIETELVERFGYSDCPRVRTPSGGLHLYFRLPQEKTARNWTSSQNRFPVAGVDVRTNGGIAVVPPSRRADGVYTWDSDTRSPPLAPAALLRALCPPAFEPRAYSPVESSIAAGASADAFAARVLRELAACPKGGRNHRLFIAAARLGELHGAGRVSDLRPDLETACQANGLVQDDGWRAVRATIESGWSRGMRQGGLG